MGVTYGSGSLGSIIRIYREEGLGPLLRKASGYVYNRTVWPLLPTTAYVTYAGVRVERRKPLDMRLPFPTPGSQQDLPDHEAVLVPAIEEHLTAGDTVVEIGGGVGATAVIAARQVGPSGHVRTYEGSPIQARRIWRTAELNGVGDRVAVETAIVSNAVRLMMGQETGQRDRVVPVSDLPPADALVIDCDGCEFELIAELDRLPETLVVEHHAVLDSDVTRVEYEPDRLRELLTGKGYEIVATEVQQMDEEMPEFGEEETVFVAVLTPQASRMA